MRRLVGVVLSGLASLTAFAGSKIAPDMPKAGTSGSVEVIVQYKNESALDAQRRWTSMGKIKRQYRTLRAVHMVVPAACDIAA